MMESTYIDNKTFEGTDFGREPLPRGEYDNCRFVNCKFAKSDLSEMKFLDCVFTDCDLSLAGLKNTTLRDTRFEGCKMLGLRFDMCNEFALSFSFEECNLDHATFFQLAIRKTLFRNSHLIEADFTAADLTASVFDNCDMAGAKFDNTLLERADFRTAYNYSIDPDTNRIKKAQFSTPAVAGLLDKYDIVIDGASR